MKAQRRKSHLHTSVVCAIVGVASAAGVVLACNALSGVDDLSVDRDGSSGGDTGKLLADAAANADVFVEPPKGCPAAGYSCVPVAPPGWIGPLIVAESKQQGDPTGQAAVACPANMALTRVGGGLAPSGSTTCSPCVCGSPNGICTATLSQFGGSDCVNTPTKTSQFTSSCLNMLAGTSSIKVNPTATATGGCSVDGGVPTNSPVAWSAAVTGCGAPQLLSDGCNNGQVCTPDSPGGATSFLPGRCIAQAGDVACPAPWSNKTTINADVTDTRGCVACTCTDPTGIACSGNAELFPSVPSCFGGVPQPIDLAATCTNVAGNSGAKFLDASITGSCTPSKTSPTGGVTAKDPVTICCTSN